MMLSAAGSSDAAAGTETGKAYFHGANSIYLESSKLYLEIHDS